jgi:transposase InsO family protein
MGYLVKEARSSLPCFLAKKPLVEIHCWNGEIVRIAFVLDTCDREVMAWVASTAGVSGEMVRDLMLLSVERRFGGYRTPHRIQWLSDNGSGYTADDTILSVAKEGPSGNRAVALSVRVTNDRLAAKLEVPSEAPQTVQLIPSHQEH